MYRVKVHRDVEKFLRRIPKHDAERIREKILSLKDPFAAKPRKVKGEENTFRLRVGDYRILFFITNHRTETPCVRGCPIIPQFFTISSVTNNLS